MPTIRKPFIALIVIAVTGFVIIQVIPAEKIHWTLARNNPPVETTIDWNSAETEQLLRDACYDCHSNETRWPWYAHIAPVSWLIARDVNKGRVGMNFSEDSLDSYDAEDMEWHLYNNMPPEIYLPLHPEANLTGDQKAQLASDFYRVFAQGEDNASPQTDMDMGS